MARDDKAEVAHRHTTSDIRGGRFPEGMLPSGIIPSIEAAQATAASKSKVIFSDLAASGTDFSNGDTWYQRIAGIIIAQWEFTGGAWAARTLDGAVVANLDASKITTGTLAAGTKITAGNPLGSRVELDEAGLRKYATDGTTVQVDLTGDVAAFSGLITGSEIIAGTAGAARIELDAAGLRQYAADGTSVLLDTADDAMIRARGSNTALGSNAQKALTTGYGDTAVGSDAQKALTTGYSNTAIGTAAQRTLTTGIDNTAVGEQAQYDATDADYNTAVGIAAQARLTTGDANTAVGYLAQGEPLGNYLNATKTASFQTSIGPMSGQSSATQVDGITTIGYKATAGSANATSIGREARADHAGSIALGYQALTTQPDQVMVGPRDVEITDTTKGLVLVSPDATRMRITVADDGSVLVNGTAIGGGGGGGTPTGTVLEFAGATAPGGFLTCDGSAVSRTTYANLYSAIGTLHGVGDGTTTFNLPDKRSRFPVGYDSSDSDYDAVGKTGGSKTHSHAAGTLAGPAHTHPLSSLGQALFAFTATPVPNIFMRRTTAASWTATHQGSSSTTPASSSSAQNVGAVLAGTTDSSGTGAVTGSSATADGRPPYIAMNYIIKT